jgi:flagellar hook-length control protein FliK
LIKGLSADNARPLPQTAKRKTEKQDENFAEQLTGAKSDGPENLNRNERNSSGRGSEDAPRERAPNREESRSNEREKDSRSPSDLRASRDDVRNREKRSESRDDDRDDRKDDRHEDSLRATNYSPASAHIPTSRMPASPSTDDEAPIVIENPKGSDSQELKLPDFFSKAALEKGALKTAAKGTAAKAAGLEGVDDAAILAGMKETEGLTRQAAMEKFVTKMQDELGIPPEKLLQAFAKLDDKAMQAAPEESMGQFLKALDLPSADMAKAGVLYKDLLKSTGDSLMNENLAGLDTGVSFDVESPRDASLRKLNTSLEDLNKSFFRKEAGDSKKAQKSLDSMDMELSKMMRQPHAKEGAGSQTAMAANSALMANAMMEASDDAEVAQASTSDANALSGLMSAQANPLAANPEAGGDLSDLLGGGAKASEQSVKMSGGKSALQSAFAEQMSKEIKDEDTDVDVSTEAGDKSALAKTDAQAVLGQDQPVASTVGKPVMGPADMMMNRQATPKEEQDNVKELIRQAQIMVKRGGGEMKMEMKPEGMGAIQLRVNVQNGQVNVQMLTESESAKHLLERGLSELKSNLAQHELKVQSLTVDVGNDVKNQMDQQATQDQARQHARQMASDFMGNFRDENQGFRQGFLENKGWRQYSRNKGPDSVQPEQVARAAATSRGDNSKRLNLVA